MNEVVNVLVNSDKYELVLLSKLYCQYLGQAGRMGGVPYRRYLLFEVL